MRNLIIDATLAIAGIKSKSTNVSQINLFASIELHSEFTTIQRAAQ